MSLLQEVKDCVQQKKFSSLENHLLEVFSDDLILVIEIATLS